MVRARTSNLSWKTSGLFAALALLSIGAGVSVGKTIHVKAGGAGDGSSWENAYGDLQSALDHADPNDDIWVAQGRYKPTSDYGLSIGNRGKHFRMKNHVGIYGGFSSAGDPNFEDRDWRTYETVLSGDLLGNDVQVGHPRDLEHEPSRADNCYHVFYHPEEIHLDPNAVLDGFTIEGANASGDGSLPNHTCYGGGMHNSGASPTVADCTFRRNSVDHDYGCGGGGMYNGNSSPNVTDCTFSENLATDRMGFGGGICNIGFSNPVITNCTFMRNHARGGGGMYTYSNSSPCWATVRDCIFRCNESHGAGGGGMLIGPGSSATVINSLFTGNSARIYRGGAIHQNGGLNVKEVELINCTIVGNQADERGGGVSLFVNQCIRLANCIVWDNRAYYWTDPGPNISGPALVSYSVVGSSGGAAPCFVDPGYWDLNGTPANTSDDFWVEGDYHLLAGSRCVDAGNNSYISPYTNRDLDGMNRFVDDPATPDTGMGRPPIVDIGAYEFPGCPLGDFDDNCNLDWADFAQFARVWLKSRFVGEYDISVPPDNRINLLDFAVFGGSWEVSRE